MSARAIRRRARESHSVIDQAPLSANVKMFAHMLVVRFASLNWREISASCETLSRWLEENYAIAGKAYRLGSRGPAKCGPKRPTLSSETIRRYVHALVRVGLLEKIGGGRAVGRRYAGKAPRGLRWRLLPSGLLRDALRGAYKAWRAEFQRLATPIAPLFSPALLASSPLSEPLPTNLGSTSALPPEERAKEESAAPTSFARVTPSTAPDARSERGDETYESARDAFASFVSRFKPSDG